MGKIAERFLQRPEPGRVRPPGADAVAVERAADLLGTRGCDRFVRQVEVEALRLEREPDRSEQRAGFTRQVLDRAIVIEQLDAAGQRRETGLGSFFGFEIGLEQRSETAN